MPLAVFGISRLCGDGASLPKHIASHRPPFSRRRQRRSELPPPHPRTSEWRPRPPPPTRSQSGSQRWGSHLHYSPDLPAAIERIPGLSRDMVQSLELTPVLSHELHSSLCPTAHAVLSCPPDPLPARTDVTATTRCDYATAQHGHLGEHEEGQGLNLVPAEHHRARRRAQNALRPPPWLCQVGPLSSSWTWSPPGMHLDDQLTDR